jgi:hypothetical protein
VLCLCFLPERTAHQDAPGDRCIAGFRFGPCPEWVQNSTHAAEAGVREHTPAPQVGDKVKFDADRVNGQITITKIEKSKYLCGTLDERCTRQRPSRGGDIRLVI